jgi:mycothione reductase
VQHFDLCVIGSGSGNTIVDRELRALRVALVEGGTFGGTCLNVGCIPTKMYVYPADLARTPAHASALGVDLRLDRVRWAAIRDRIFGRIDPISASGRAWRERSGNVTLFSEQAHFVGPRTLDTGAAGSITADRFVVAAGSRPFIPDLPGLESVPYHTSDSVMRLAELPSSMIIVGGGYIAAEFAHIFSAFGTAVTIINRSELLLRHQDTEVAERFTALLGGHVDVHAKAEVQHLTSTNRRIQAVIDQAGGETTIEADVLLLATGRIPNGDTLNLDAAGIAIDDAGLVVVDDQQRTTAEGVFALGDVSSNHQLKHVANHEARVVHHNLLHPDSMITSDHRFVPQAVFSQPQVASVGLTEQQAHDRGIDYRVGRADYGSTAYGWAMEDTDHFVKIIVEAGSQLIVGAHLLGPQASSMIQPLIQAMVFGQTAPEIARGQYWIHPAMIEVVENALLDAR